MVKSRGFSKERHAAIPAITSRLHAGHHWPAAQCWVPHWESRSVPRRILGIVVGGLEFVDGASCWTHGYDSDCEHFTEISDLNAGFHRRAIIKLAELAHAGEVGLLGGAE